jgi:2-dehydro-3-deoxygluconokinase
MAHLVTFGEAMLRLAPPDFMRIEQTGRFDVLIGGAELNVAVGAARLGLGAAYVTRLPRGPLGRIIENKSREHGVDTRHILWTDDGRVGLYFLEFGGKPRAAQVIYDRADSAMSRIGPGEVDWPRALEGARVFHTTGITAAISQSAREATEEAIAAAREAGLLVSFDPNYRSRLWGPEEARECLAELTRHSDILNTNVADANLILGRSQGESDPGEMARALAETFDLRVAVVSFGEAPLVWRNTRSAVAYADGTLYDDATYEMEIVDRIGGGDAFCAGFLVEYLATDGDVDRALRFGNAFSALKHTIPGDFNWTTREEAEALLSGGDLWTRR